MFHVATQLIIYYYYYYLLFLFFVVIASWQTDSEIKVEEPGGLYCINSNSAMNRVVQDQQSSDASMTLFSETRQEWKQDTPLSKSWIDPQRAVENQ